MARLLVLVGRQRLLVGRLGLLVLLGRLVDRARLLVGGLVDRGRLLVGRLGLLVRGLERNMSKLQKAESIKEIALPAGQLGVGE